MLDTIYTTSVHSIAESGLTFLSPNMMNSTTTANDTVSITAWLFRVILVLVTFATLPALA